MVLDAVSVYTNYVMLFCGQSEYKESVGANTFAHKILVGRKNNNKKKPRH